MKIEITYIHHNCFVLKTEARSFLFDYPNDSHLPDGAADMVRRAVSGEDLAVFISHSHDDHLNDDIAQVTSSAKNVCYVLSDDVEDMRPGCVPQDASVLLVEPDESFEFEGMKIETLVSNDLGVAFLVSDGAFRFYYGGDLAKWIWDTASPKEVAFTERFFEAAMERVRQFRPHVAFSNTDGRLANLAGGDDACRIIQARVFVPMHVFGKTDWLAGFRERVGRTSSELFLYEKPGDTSRFSF